MRGYRFLSYVGTSYEPEGKVRRLYEVNPGGCLYIARAALGQLEEELAHLQELLNRQGGQIMREERVLRRERERQEAAQAA